MAVIGGAAEAVDLAKFLNCVAIAFNSAPVTEEV